MALQGTHLRRPKDRTEEPDDDDERVPGREGPGQLHAAHPAPRGRERASPSTDFEARHSQPFVPLCHYSTAPADSVVHEDREQEADDADEEVANLDEGRHAQFTSPRADSYRNPLRMKADSSHERQHYARRPTSAVKSPKSGSAQASRQTRLTSVPRTRARPRGVATTRASSSASVDGKSEIGKLARSVTYEGACEGAALSFCNTIFCPLRDDPFKFKREWGEAY